MRFEFLHPPEGELAAAARSNALSCVLRIAAAGVPTTLLTGDIELGLTARNLLDRLPWEKVPLGLRIALNRGARFARAARGAYHAKT